jgi:hypothetical protein
VLRALAAGKRVFVEKPLADTIDDLTGIVEANSAARGKVMVDTWCASTRSPDPSKRWSAQGSSATSSIIVGAKAASCCRAASDF